MDKLILEDGEYITEFPKKRFNKKPSPKSQDILAPIPGVIVELKKKEGDVIISGETVLTLDAMKMENGITSNSAGRIEKIFVKVGDKVKKNDILMKLVIGGRK